MPTRCIVQDTGVEPFDLVVRCAGSDIALRVAWSASPSAALPLDPRTTLAIGTEVRGEQPAWMPGARREFESSIPTVERWAAGRTLAVWPAAGGVISDVPSLLSFLRTHPAWRFVLEPLALLTEAMRGNAEEHLRRMAEALEDHGALAGVVMPAKEDSLRNLVERAFDGLGESAWVAERVASGHLQ
ncbi:hypothetical protein PHYC_02809 [Phycisphaerales bacterium]|nr:hypothetical protein PHYC_02809 [Phycisphaerales bacterium]